MLIYKIFFKFFIDFIISVSFFLMFFPLFVSICILLLFFNKGKIFYIQARPGKNNKIFKIIKFKTMNDKRDKEGNFLPDSLRLTKIGKFVRQTSLDELPQLINVIKGDMSLVGPRPLLVQYLPLYNEFQKRRHTVKPGITGWAQVNGRNAISWQQKFEYDVWYTNNISFFLDFKIILLTIKKVFKREGISSASSVTMEAFNGNLSQDKSENKSNKVKIGKFVDK
jgi:undecaprenyl phosphate N,N'-diacetylbacillosamine 1-phosphate transferase